MKLIKEKKVNLCVITQNLVLNGISTIVVNYCENLQIEDYNITILTGDDVAEEYKSRFLGSNIKIEICPRKDRDKIGYYKAIYKYLKNNKSDIVHVHGNSAIASIELFLARLCKVKKVVMHSHNTTCDHTRIHYILRPLLGYLCDEKCACGEMAGKWLYGKNRFDVIPNAFDTKKFAFSEIERKKIRSKLNISEKTTVIGHVGLFNMQKNHHFLIEIFAEYLQNNPDSLLLIIGKGREQTTNKIKEQINSLGISKNVILYGTTDDMSSMYSAMDTFLFPSLFEGLPVALLEAQISGVPCVVSDTITREVNLGGDMKYVSLKKNAREWAQYIHRINNDERVKCYEKYYNYIINYDIKNTVEVMDGIYRR